MSKLQELIDKLCPNGVEFKPLGALGTFENIGVDKKTNPNEKEVTLLNYMDVYKCQYIDKTVPQMIVTASDKKIFQCSVEQWDVFVTPTSETRDDIGHASVVTETLDNTVYSYHIMRFRLNNPNRTLACYIRYLFETTVVQKQIYRFASGLTRFGLSKYKFAQIEIPVPPIEIQEEIVRILDHLVDYAAELQAELQARKQQYEYYRNLLLTFNPSAYGCGTDDEQKDGVTTWGGHNYKIEWKKMGEIGTFIRGNGLQKKDFTESGVGCIHYGQIYTHYGTFATKTKSFVSESFAQKLRKAKTGDIVIATTSENVEDVGKAVAWLGNEDIAISGDAYIYTHEQNPKFIAYLFQTERFLAFKKMNVSGTKVTRISGDSLAKYPIPLPPLELQEKIVAILDRFETLVNDLTNGLPAEIAAVKDQYEYYRNKLLTFKKLSA